MGPVGREPSLVALVLVLLRFGASALRARASAVPSLRSSQQDETWTLLAGHGSLQRSPNGSFLFTTPKNAWLLLDVPLKPPRKGTLEKRQAHMLKEKVGLRPSRIPCWFHEVAWLIAKGRSPFGVIDKPSVSRRSRGAIRSLTKDQPSKNLRNYTNSSGL